MSATALACCSNGTDNFQTRQLISSAAERMDDICLLRESKRERERESEEGCGESENKDDKSE